MRPGHPTGSVRGLLRAEGAAVALVMAVLSWQFAPPWWLVVLVLAAPDLAILGYLRGPKIGAALYNAAHSYAGPALLGAAALAWGAAGAGTVAALWALHVGFDRALGYGLKYPTSFHDTHLGPIGRD